MTQERPSAPAKQRMQIPRICASSLISDLAGQVTCTHPKQSAAEEGVCSDSLTSGLKPLSANAALDPTVISFASSSLISWPSEADHGEHGSHTPVNKELRSRPAHPITFAVPAYSTTGNMAHTINQGAFPNWLIEFNRQWNNTIPQAVVGTICQCFDAGFDQDSVILIVDNWVEHGTGLSAGAFDPHDADVKSG